jgi:hypothetical protein
MTLTAVARRVAAANAAILTAALIVFGFGALTPGMAADWGLTLFVKSEPPVSADPGPVSYAPGSRAVARLIFENRGEAPLESVQVQVDLIGAVPVVETAGNWKRDGNKITTTLNKLSPGDSVELPLVVELADGTERGARGTGGEARIRASVPASGETLVAEANWPIANCADAYHAALRQIRYNEFAALRTAVDASRVSDKSLPGDTEITFKPEGGKQVASAVRFAEGFARSRGLDSYYTGKDIRWVTGRLINDIAVYLGQDRYPGLCTGVDEWTGILQDYMGRFTKRADEINAYREALEPTVDELVTAASQGAVSAGNGGTDPRATASALLSATGYSGTQAAGVGIFVTAQKAIADEGDTLTTDRRQALTEAFAALERLWYLDLAAQNAGAVATGFTGTLGAIRSAQKASCTCGS